MSMASLVERATSDLLISPDWGRNLELCDAVNSDPGQAKEVVKAAKKRLANKNPSVQLLTLTVLETLIKNCGDAVHQQVAERDVLHEMVKIVKKKADMTVRDKILSLLDSWQEAFGGQRGRYPQYYAAYDELRRSGVEFPQREDAVPIFTPPQSHPITAYPAPYPTPPPYASYPGPPPQVPVENDIQPLSLADLENARGGLEVLTEMLNAIDPRDKAAVNDELIVELVEQCRTSQRQVMSLVNTTTDETLLFQALSLNDDLQKVLAKHDAIAIGAPIPPEDTPLPAPPSNFVHDDEESEDDFAQLAHRTARMRQNPKEQPKPGPVPVKIPGPPVQVTRLPAPPGDTRRHTSPAAVDLLSGDMFGGTRSAQAAATLANQQKTEDADNINPFSLQPKQHEQALKQEPSTNGPPSTSQYAAAPWETGSSQAQPLSPQQQALLYGADAYPASSPALAPPSTLQNTSVLPPPPIKHSQRQQYFQQHQQPDQSELAARTQKLSLDPDDGLVNPYAALYSQQKQQEQQAQPRPSGFQQPAERKTDSLFSDLVELQSARMKSGSGGECDVAAELDQWEMREGNI